MPESDSTLDIDSFWEYGDPAASEARFHAAATSAQGDERLELLTQNARTYSLRQRLAEAHGLLDGVTRGLAEACTRPRGSKLMYRCRTLTPGEQTQ